MLEACGDRILAAETRALITTDRSRPKNPVGIRIFPIPFRHAAPARVAGHIDHRRECPVHPAASGFPSRMRAHPLDQCRIPRAGLTQRNLVQGLETVDVVIAKEDGNPKPGLLHGLFLHGIPQRGVCVEINEGTDFGRNLLHGFPDIVHIVVPSQCILVQLQHLLMDGHAGKEILHTHIFRRRCVQIPRPPRVRPSLIIGLHHIPGLFLGAVVGQQAFAVEKLLVGRMLPIRTQEVEEHPGRNAGQIGYAGKHGQVVMVQRRLIIFAP